MVNKKYGKYAFITGAARGIGKAFAEELIERGYDLIISDMLDQELQATQAELAKKFPANEVIAIKADLSSEEDFKSLTQQIDAYDIGLFCGNHSMVGISPDGSLSAWSDEDITLHHHMVKINISSYIELLHYFINRMRKQMKGAILIVSSSSAAFRGSAYIAQYGATKSYQLYLGEALWYELKPKGIDVLTVLPGSIKTENLLLRLNKHGLKATDMMTPKQVAVESLNALGKTSVIIPGYKNRLGYFILTRLISRQWVTTLLSKIIAKNFKIKNL